MQIKVFADISVTTVERILGNMLHKGAITKTGTTRGARLSCPLLDQHHILPLMPVAKSQRLFINSSCICCSIIQFGTVELKKQTGCDNGCTDIRNWLCQQDTEDASAVIAVCRNWFSH